MTPEVFKYLVVSAFVILTYYLSLKGMAKTKDMKGFSIGNKDLNPFIVGITMAASISSTATFVINPGFVYNHGLAAYMHYGIAASLGILAAFLVLTRSFRRIGDNNGALTVPDWIYHRYGSRGLSLFFAGINLFSITFVVLILVGCAILMNNLFGLSQHVSLVLIMVFVFSYVLLGGSYAHVYTNTFQGVMMLGIALFLFIQGFKYFDGGFIASLEGVSPSFASVMNSDSNLYFDFVSVFLSGFVITFALMLQPHILTKVLYLKNDSDVNKFIGTTIVVGICFSLMLFIGFYARLSGLDIERQDAVVATYIMNEFQGSSWGAYFLTFITVTLLAAGMSTLDGILVALSSMIVKDIYIPLKGTSEVNPQTALKISRYVLVAIGLISLAIAWNPPRLVGLFAQKGVYSLAAASVVPIVVGVLMKGNVSARVIFLASAIGFIGHLSLNSFGGVTNPAVSSTYSIFLSAIFTALMLGIAKFNNNQMIIEEQKG